MSDVAASEKLLRIVAANYPAYLSIIEKDLTVGFTSGREFARRNLDPDSFVGMTLEQVFGEHAPVVREQYLRAFAGEAVSFELQIDDQVQLFNATPLPGETGEIGRILAVVQDITDRRRAEEGQRQALAELGGRVKELDCLYGVLDLVGTPGISLEAILQGTADLLPPAWQYPDITCARITLGEREYCTAAYRETEWCQAADLLAGGVTIGQVAVYYLEARPERDEGPFLKQERALLGAVAERLGKTIGQTRTEAALRESEERYRTVVEHSPAGILIIGGAFRILYANGQVGQILGHPLGTIVGQDFRHFLDEETWQLLADRYVRRQRGEEVPSRYEFAVVHQDGEKRWVEASVTILRDSSGAARSVAQILDITERKQAEDERSLNERRLNSLLELSQMARELSEPEIVQAAIEQAVSLTGSEIGYSHFVNPDQQTIRLVTWSEKTMEQCTAVYETHYPLEQAGVWADCVRLGRPVVHNDYQSLPDRKGYPLGHAHLVRHASVPVFDAGRVVLILGVGNKPGDYDETDVRQMLLIGDQLFKILERRRADEELLKLSRAIAQSPSTAVITDTHGNIEYVNPKFTEVSGYAPEEVIGRNPRILQSGDQPPQFFADLWGTILAGGEWQGEFSNRKKSGQVYWELASISPIRSAAGEVTHYLKVAEDITARKQAEEALRERTVELQARNEELDAFAHTVAHDLKNPLSLVIGFAEILESTFDALADEALVEYLRQIARNGRKMDSIISELLLLAAVRKSDVELAALDMGRIVTEVQQRLAAMIENTGAEVLVPPVWPAALGHGPWVEAVWVNYISNAIKYGGDPPRVELGADVPGPEAPWVRFWVRDNGLGLTQAEQKKLFAPFTRLAQVRAEGHGLGLSIVRRIVEKLGGEVGVESSTVPGNGSVFTFTLPRAEA